jgi:hypothetical protein
MDIKWFFVAVGIFLTFAILSGMYFIGTFISQQAQFNADRQLNNSQINFNRSIFIHDSLFDNITSLKQKLDPILATVKNASQAEIDRQIHYNQTTEDFATIKQILKIKLEDHQTLNQVNVTVNNIEAILLGKSPVSTDPVKSDICNNDTVIPIENITDKGLNNLHRC